ncbi:alpha/beta fold hydrolase [Bacillus sp. AFS031507]|uniref:alpha/beta fold hydrolase n=1 Tax=Bacillus sp. AFS031507 TaxID=2033496 RepID=UPI000BFD813D|nr:alpha/beta hydrolase [Bacillus sp. AFS031507]PGY13023.1 hypothetical protein COE25_07545 [Bacillus sp. AFS031507]
MNYIDMGQGETLVFVHGFSSNKESWTCQFDLAENYRLIIPELRGHGKSVVFENISIQQFAKDVLDLLDELNIDKAHFCGLSLGGIIVQEIYKQQPHRVSSLILSNTFSQISNVFNILFTFYFKYRLKKYTKMDGDEIISKAVKRIIYNNKNEDLLENAKSALTYNEKGFANTLVSLPKGFSYLNMLSTLPVPILILGSKNDKLAPVRYAKQSYRNANKSKAELHIFDKAGHLPNIEHKEEYNQKLLEFLQSVC